MNVRERTQPKAEPSRWLAKWFASHASFVIRRLGSAKLLSRQMQHWREPHVLGQRQSAGALHDGMTLVLPPSRLAQRR